MMNLHTIEGFNRYLFDRNTNRVWSKSAERFMAVNQSGKYQLIADGARYTYGGSNREATHLTPAAVRARTTNRTVSVGGSATASASIKGFEKPWMIMKVVCETFAIVHRCDTEAQAKTAAGNMAASNVGSVYVIAEQKHRVKAAALVWE